MKAKWKKGILDRLYNHDGKTLQEIGDIYGATRERVRQVMRELGVPYTRKRIYKGRPGARFSSLEDYLNNGKENGPALRRYMPKILCSLCGGTKNLHIHHKHYPATKSNDLEILCSSCHKIEHNNGIKKETRQEIYQKHLDGQSAKTIAQNYGIAPVTVYKIYSMVRYGKTTYRD